MAFSKSWLIYGANGYTGEMIAREAKKRGLSPILAGRSRSKVESLAFELGLESRVFDLDDASEALKGIALVMHCAGPFSSTAEPMIKACLAAKAHYLDVTGEIDVFEYAQTLNQQAQAAGIVICPGVGFDVIPTDCVAASLKLALPDATHLALGFDTRSTPSPGTAKTAIEGWGLGGRIRSEGSIINVPQAWLCRKIDFGSGEKWATTIPWGDVSTAFQSTNIPNIEVYIPVPWVLIKTAKASNILNWFWRRKDVIGVIQKLIDKTVVGPDTEQRDGHFTEVWGEARNAAGQIRTARIRLPHVYDVTVTGALGIIEHLMRNSSSVGSRTPSQIMGVDYITRLPGAGVLQIN